LTNHVPVCKVYYKTIGTGCEGASGVANFVLERLYMKILRRLPMSTTRKVYSIIVFVCLLTISNCTTLVAGVNFNVAWGPSPEVNATNVHYKHDDGNSITLSWQPGDFAKQHDVYFGTSTGTLIYQGTRYDANSDPLNWTIADFNFKVNTNYYWRIDETNDSNVVSQGNVWKFTTHDGKAYNPKPYSGKIGLSEPLTLSWTAGDWAQSANGHRVYFGTDAGYVTIAGTATTKVYRGTTTNSSYSLTSLYPDYTLVPGTTYYWRVDEVNGTTIWKGPTWNFTAAEYVNIDDFEDYNTTAELQATWLTGYSTRCFDCPIDPNCDCNGWWPLPKCCSPDPNCGYVVGGGRISFVRDAYGRHMRFTYTNDGTNEFYFSEAKRSYKTGTSFTGMGVLNPYLWALRVDYIGTATNSIDPDFDRMYIALEDTAGNVAIYQNEDPNAARTETWTTWLISLRDINAMGMSSPVKLSAVTGFAMGFGVRCNFESLGGDGNVMFDNIRLYAGCWRSGPPEDPDLDSNGTINLQDLAWMAEYWLVEFSSGPIPISAPRADIYPDCMIDFKDFSVLGSGWKNP
jgi:hypothetical protein